MHYFEREGKQTLTIMLNYPDICMREFRCSDYTRQSNFFARIQEKFLKKKKQYLKPRAQSCLEEYYPKARGLFCSWRSGLRKLFYAIRWADLPEKIPSRCWLMHNSCHAQGHNKKILPVVLSQASTMKAATIHCQNTLNTIKLTLVYVFFI